MKAKALAAVFSLVAILSGWAQNPVPASGPSAQAARGSSKKAWFVRLVPPRSTFAQDITEPEKTLMQDHYAYWTARFDEGVCVFGGPVLDPKGVYGVLAIHAASEDEARSIASGDPAVKAGLLRPEVAEMNIAFPPAATSH